MLSKCSRTSSLPVCNFRCLWTHVQTRMHSSRMRTARSSGRLGGACFGGSPPGTPQARPPPGTGTPPPHNWEQAPLRDQAPPGTRHPPVDRHTPVNILPCPKLRLRAAITSFLYQFLRVSLLVEMYDNQYGLFTSSSTLIDPNRYQHCYHPPTK